MQQSHSIALSPISASLSGLDNDEHLIEMWLLDKQSELTREKYEADIDRFRAWTGFLPLAQIKLPLLREYEQTFYCTLCKGPGDRQSLEIGHARHMRILACIKSLLTYGERLGYLPYNVGKGIQLKRVPDQRGRRYLSEEEVMGMVALEPDPRNHALIRLLYSGGLRVSELCSLTWRDVLDRPDKGTGQVIVWGKGNKERVIVLKPETYVEIAALRPLHAAPDAPVFTSRQSDEDGRALDQSQVYRIVEQAAIRAGLHTYTTDTGVTHSRVSPHWLRHSHASHYMERKGNVVVLQHTLGHASLATTTLYAHARPDDSSSLALGL